MNDYRIREAERRKQKKRKRAIIKNWTILIETIIILVLTVALITLSISYNNLRNYNNTSSLPSLPNNSNSTSSITLSASDETSSKAEWMKNELDKWYLKLVNPDNGVDNEFIRNVELAEIDARFSSGASSSKYFDKRAVDALVDMCEAALNDNVSLICVSTYRTYAYQQTLYNSRVQRCINEGYGKDEAKKVAATIVAVPGTSEHHMGLAVDFNSVEESFEDTMAFKWLHEHAEDYGFIMRYPKDKKDITKIIYEPWHYRYVGVEHAKAMNDLGLCMEEYLDYLSKGGTLN